MSPSTVASSQVLKGLRLVPQARSFATSSVCSYNTFKQLLPLTHHRHSTITTANKLSNKQLFFSTSTSTGSKINSSNMSPQAADALIELAKARRSYYALTKDLPITPARIQELVNQTTLHTPTSFNSQTTRVLVLFGAEHDKLWDATTEILKAIVPEAEWEHTATRMNMFKGAAGTALFFADQDGVNAMQEKFALYADRFPPWAEQSAGMQQFLLWTALEAEGLGANLQHYNPLIDQKVAENWGVPSSWKLNAQLVFGGRGGDAQPKDFLPIEDRVKVFGA